MRMRVHQAWNQYVRGTIDALGGRKTLDGEARRLNGDDPALPDGDRMALEHAGLGFDRDDPTRRDQRVDLLHETFGIAQFRGGFALSRKYSLGGARLRCADSSAKPLAVITFGTLSP